MGAMDKLLTWSGPFGGLPPFDHIAIEDFEPAFAAAMDRQWSDIEAIVDQDDPPDFENSIAAFERSGQALARLRALFAVWQTCLSTPELRDLAKRILPRLAAFDDRIVQNSALFARIDTVATASINGDLDPEQQRLLRHHRRYFIERGAALGPADQQELRAINERLAVLQARFAQNILADEEQGAVVLEHAAQLGGISDSLREVYAQDAAVHGRAGCWRIANTRAAAEPFLTYADDRDARRTVHEMWTRRGESRNNPVARDILQDRARKAALLGYPTYAHWHLGDTMAKHPDTALALCRAVWDAAIAQLDRDLAELQAEVDGWPQPYRIEPWDIRYVANQVRNARFDLDLNEVRGFLELDQVRNAAFETARRLFGLAFRRLDGVPVYHPDMMVFEVTDRAGEHVGLLYVDAFARPGKASGAWMSAYRDQSTAYGPIRPIVSNNLNIVRPAPGRPTYLSLDDARTLFHEMGHALHGLCSSVRYASFAGVNCARDFVEFPSQFLENYLLTPEILARFVDSGGEKMPDALIAKLRASANFGRAFLVVEAQACAIADLMLHLAPDVADPTGFAEQSMDDLGLPRSVTMRHRVPHFAHIFGEEGYAARYYSYIWAEVIAHDSFAAFLDAGGPWHSATAERLLAELLSIGGSVDPEAAFRRFRSRDPQPEALTRALGLDMAA